MATKRKAKCKWYVGWGAHDKPTLKRLCGRNKVRGMLGPYTKAEAKRAKRRVIDAQEGN